MKTLTTLEVVRGKSWRFWQIGGFFGRRGGLGPLADFRVRILEQDGDAPVRVLLPNQLHLLAVSGRKVALRFHDLAVLDVYEVGV